MTKKCPYCGKFFEASNPQQVYCSSRCRQNFGANKYYRKKSRVNLNSKICPICGSVFVPKLETQTYCSEECMAKSPEANREFYPGTVLLLHKWYRGGDTIDDLMELTGRSREHILIALSQKLSEEEEKIIEKSLPYKKQRKIF